MQIAQAVFFVPPDQELLIFRVDRFATMDWANLLALSMEVDSLAIFNRNQRSIKEKSSSPGQTNGASGAASADCLPPILLLSVPIHPLRVVAQM
ncbi:unnamed protein product [Heligmosomoides polygyrus]|uniref:FERM domain-containing protein n=1 Tax=Heligmosomoides polygyrus TaxID=6339 RepID=A0A3P8CNT2_HELPZ|nr:unnamed protein product [Heligmosomoides polygyrus]